VSIPLLFPSRPNTRFTWLHTH